MTCRNSPAIRAAVFDFDGTLFDTREAIVHSFQAALAERGHAPVAREAILRRIGRPLFEMFLRLVPGVAGPEVEQLIEAYRRAFAPVAVALSRPIEGLDRCVCDLKAAGVRLAIVTHRLSDGARLILDGFRLGSAFDAVFGLEHLERLKPDPTPIRQALGAVGIPPAQAVVVGDTPDDMRAGRAAGTWTVGIAARPRRRRLLLDAGAHRTARTLVSVSRWVVPARSRHLSALRRAPAGRQSCRDVTMSSAVLKMPSGPADRSS